MSVRVEVDLSLLYQKLCPMCKATMVSLAVARLPEEMTTSILQGKQPKTKKKHKPKRKP